MDIISIEPIVWKTWKPHIVKDFPCFVCRKEIATIFVKLQKDQIIVKLPICELCSKKEIANLKL